ncbi:SRPBCC family protein [Phytoactinopolyspora endophytica]|uniref:SRPBCC family protein n=1 Tax=Phytoactinopolyspora endophytica TaxID=1642495 RepID=UPI00101C53F4|nr:SRPBCC domain-containing protein [Phytoactinopolyspora endophytica]
MNDNSYTTSFTVNNTPAEVFEAITNPRGWWSEEIDGGTDTIGDVFVYSYGDAHRCSMKLTEAVPGKKVVWQVLENYFGPNEDPEWKDTEIVFDISQTATGTELRFTHVGLVPQFECYDICSQGWGSYIGGSLHNLITTGQGTPNKNGARP